MGGSGGAPGAALAVVAPEAAGAVPDRVVAGEMPADEDAEAGAGAAARLFGQVEGQAIGGEQVGAGPAPAPPAAEPTAAVRRGRPATRRGRVRRAARS